MSSKAGGCLGGSLSMSAVGNVGTGVVLGVGGELHAGLFDSGVRCPTI